MAYNVTARTDSSSSRVGLITGAAASPRSAGTTGVFGKLKSFLPKTLKAAPQPESPQAQYQPLDAGGAAASTSTDKAAEKAEKQKIFEAALKTIADNLAPEKINNLSADELQTLIKTQEKELEEVLKLNPNRTKEQVIKGAALTSTGLMVGGSAAFVGILLGAPELTGAAAYAALGTTGGSAALGYVGAQATVPEFTTFRGSATDDAIKNAKRVLKEKQKAESLQARQQANQNTNDLDI